MDALLRERPLVSRWKRALYLLWDSLVLAFLLVYLSSVRDSSAPSSPGWSQGIFSQMLFQRDSLRGRVMVWPLGVFVPSSCQAAFFDFKGDFILLFFLAVSFYGPLDTSSSSSFDPLFILAVLVVKGRGSLAVTVLNSADFFTNLRSISIFDIWSILC